MPLLMSLVILAVAGTGSWADVSFVEQIVNSGFGPKKTGARKTTNRVYIKGHRQRVHSEIEAGKAETRTLKKQGVPLTGSTILQLDQASLYSYDHARQAFTHQPLPPASIAAPSAAKRVATDPNREVTFESKELAETKSIGGIVCHKVAVQMRVRHMTPGTKKVRRQNRYLYQAWVATEFPGYEEIEGFRRLQEQKTSHPSLIGGGLEQIENAADDYGDISEEIEALKGFPMHSILKVYTKSGKKKERQIFQLSRKVTSLSYAALPDTLFEAASGGAPDPVRRDNPQSLRRR